MSEPEERPRRPAPVGRAHPEIPIVDADQRIIGWSTQEANVGAGGEVIHLDAQKLISGPLVCACIRVYDPVHAARAGAPPGWKGEWRCLAICDVKATFRIGHDVGDVVIRV